MRCQHHNWGPFRELSRSMMHGAPQSGNMNVQDEQSAHEEHGLASRDSRESAHPHPVRSENAHHGTSSNGAENGDDASAGNGDNNYSNNGKRGNERRTCE